MRQITETIRQNYDQLSPSERRVAGFIIDHLDDLATYNSVELSRQCNTSKATISRLFRRLGYDSFKQAREELRRLRQSGVPLPGSMQAGVSLVDRHFASEQQNLQRLAALAQSSQLSDITEQLAEAKNVAVIGFRNSYPIALHLRQQLQQVRASVRLLPQPGQTLGEELVELTPDDLVILVAFHRRPSGFRTLLNTLQQQQIPTVLLCESNSGLMAGGKGMVLELPLDTVSAFDSYALPMSLASLLSNLLLHHQLEQGRSRIEQINELYDLTGELDISY